MIMKIDVAEIDAQGLRKFGFLLASMFALVFGIIVSWVIEQFMLWPWLFCVLFLIWAWLHPQSIRPVYYAWMTLAFFMGNLVSFTALWLIFHLMIIPIGMLLRLVKPYAPIHDGWINPDERDKTHFEKPY